MSETKPLLLVLVGMPGAGKSSCVDYLNQKGYPSVYFGGITLKEMKKRGLQVTADNEKFVREDLRRLHGKEAYAKLIAKEIQQLQTSGQHHIVVDGLYSWSEYKFFKKSYGDNAIILAIAATRQLRHERLQNRPVRPLSEDEVIEREYAEIENIEKGGPIANADYTIVNDHGVKELMVQFQHMLRQISF